MKTREEQIEEMAKANHGLKEYSFIALLAIIV